MKLKQILLYFSLFTFHFSLLFSQEHADHLVPLRTNPALVNYANLAKKNHKHIGRLVSDSIVLILPFLDDFSHGGPYPDTALWLDNEAFINNTYPICPPTLGVATLDGVNNEGQPYNPNCPPGASYPADVLTSRPINLTYNGLNVGDSVWFSFYWQAGGRGLLPLPSDSLLLQFRTSRIPWTTVWYHLGYLPSPTDTGFHLVMIPMTDTIHGAVDTTIRINPYDPNFQFRFTNYACTSADADQWNIDVVYLNARRTYTDTAKSNVSFVYESPSLLANYEYMPWEQFTANDLKDTMYVQERNNSNGLIKMGYRDTILPVPLAYPTGTGYNGEYDNILPFDTNGYQKAKSQTHIPIKAQYNYAPLTRISDITFTQILSSSPQFIPWDDTLKFDQVFSDYYAYDDGTAEASYFINGTVPIELAYQFTLNKPDTLRGLEFYFNYMFVNPANYNMILAIWDNSGSNGSPGKRIFENNDTDVATPRTSDTLNGFTFYPYYFSSPAAAVMQPGTFYVGWIQTNGDSLNIGFDLNTNSQSKIYYNVNTYPGGWQPGDYAGSMMMRPVFGRAYGHYPLLGTPAIKAPEALSLYPNPAKDMVNLSASMPANSTLKIYTADGRQYLSNDSFSGNSINTSAIPAGFYIVEITPQGGQAFFQKLLIQR